MTVLPNMDAVPTHAADWYSIDWDQAHRVVKRLQVRIAKATLCFRLGPTNPRLSIGLSCVSGKLSCTVLRGGCHSNVMPLPDLKSNYMF
jgi:hypothetical protein